MVAGIKDFPETLPGANHYQYDLNGNLTNDDYRSLSFQYNSYNLPYQLDFVNNKIISYFYDGAGQKLSKIVFTGIANPACTEYMGAFVHQDSMGGTSSLKYIITPEGRIKNTGTNAIPVWGWEYDLTDHLGNVRVTFKPNATNNGVVRLGYANYFPFGMGMPSPYTTGALSNYLYNGKELQNDFTLGCYDYGARFYDPAIGRWQSVDLLAEKYINTSPYAYCVNNPVKFVDVDGREIVIRVNAGGSIMDLNLTRNGLVDSKGNLISVPVSLHPGQIVDGYMKMLKSGDANYIKQVTTLINSKNTHNIDATKIEKNSVVPGNISELMSEAKSKAIEGKGIGTTTNFDFSEKALEDGTPKSNYTTVSHEVQHQYDFDQGKMSDHYDKNGERIEGSKNPAEERAVKNEDKARDQEKLNRRDKY